MDLESTIDDTEENTDDETGEEEEEEVSHVKKYSCDICAYTTIYSRLIRTHREQHTPSEERQACCPYCPYYVTVKSALHRHLAVHPEHQETRLNESQNNVDGTESENAVEDMETSEAEGNDDDTDNEEDDVDNGSDNFSDDDGTDEKYRCNICPYTTIYKRLIKVHTEQHKPSKERQACCPYCPFYVKRERGLVRHVVVHKEHQAKKSEENEMEEDDDESDDEVDAEDDIDTNEKIYACNICPYTTVHRRLIRVHTTKHTPSEDRKARCDYCPYYGSVKALLGKHMIVHKEYRELKGIDAEEDSISTGADNAPMDDDDDTTMRQCKLCPYLASTGHSLKRHTAFHTASEERQVQCPYCPYFVKSQARLANHLIVHREHSTERESDSEESSDEVVNCSVCPFMSSSRKEMDVHEKHHVPSEDQPNKCPTLPVLRTRFYTNRTPCKIALG